MARAGAGTSAYPLAAALTWLGERLYHLAALDIAPFNDQDTPVDVLSHIWMNSVYGKAPDAELPAQASRPVPAPSAGRGVRLGRPRMVMVVEVAAFFCGTTVIPVTRLTTRSLSALAASALIACLTAGCSSSPDPAPSPTGYAVGAGRLGEAAALIVQCALTQGLMKPPTGLATPSGQTPWLKGTKLVLTSANAGTFNEWYNSVAGIKIAGEEIGEWVQETADSGKLPAAVCGASVTASDLQKQVFAGDPAAANPW